MKSAKVGVIIPAYNEASVINKVISSMPRTIINAGTKYYIIPVVVNDASTDETSAVVSNFPQALLVSHIINSGAGAATRTGLRYLRENDFDYGATMDGDGQHTSKDLKRVLFGVLQGGTDLVIGSRLVDARGMPWYKIAGNKGLNIITKLLLGVSSTDSQSGLKAFNRKTIEQLDYRENGYAFCSEMLWRAHKANLVVSEVPIQAIYTDYSVAKGQSNWNAFQIIKQLVRHRLADIIHE